MHPNAEIIEQFYTAFQHQDYETMNSFYAENATFSDPVFPDLNGKQVRAMWHMLCTASDQTKVTFKDIVAEDGQGYVHWEARYTFNTRPVHNIVEAFFTFDENQKILTHKDDYDLSRWARMALGPTGLVLGWTPMVQNRIRQMGAQRLEHFIQKHPAYQG